MRRRRWKSRNPRKSSRKRAIFLVLILFTLFSLQSFIYIEKRLKPPLTHLATIRMKQVVTQSVNATLSEKITEEANLDKLMEWKHGQDGKVNGFVLNYAEHMKITSRSVDIVQGLLQDLQAHTEKIPLGLVLDSAIIASYGPKIPIRMSPQGAVQVELGRRYESVGINMVLAEVYIRIIADVAVIVPFSSEHEVIETEVPLSYVLIIGDTPMYYVDNKGNPVGNSSPLPPSVTLPEMRTPGGGALPITPQ
ncbi:sporulation protein YunB [Paenibacillus senegalensis]|uniref:sporulation protein YunB n=1 Tax=Paenibacillus senegalensis TaxID=1465766 RepID=UPI000288C8D3|nr:sporulation protein YunB [Paenibacillus senegalensis]